MSINNENNTNISMKIICNRAFNFDFFHVKVIDENTKVELTKRSYEVDKETLYKEDEAPIFFNEKDIIRLVKQYNVDKIYLVCGMDVRINKEIDEESMKYFIDTYFPSISYVIEKIKDNVVPKEYSMLFG